MTMAVSTVVNMEASTGHTGSIFSQAPSFLINLLVNPSAAFTYDHCQPLKALEFVMPSYTFSTQPNRHCKHPKKLWLNMKKYYTVLNKRELSQAISCDL